MEGLQFPDCEVVGADKKMRRPSIDRANYRIHPPSRMTGKVVLDTAYLADRMPKRRERGDAKPDAGQCYRYSAGKGGVLGRNNQYLWLRDGLVRARFHCKAERALSR